MNTKIIVALVIGIALVGLTGAASADPSITFPVTADIEYVMVGTYSAEELNDDNVDVIQSSGAYYSQDVIIFDWWSGVEDDSYTAGSVHNFVWPTYHDASGDIAGQIVQAGAASSALIESDVVGGAVASAQVVTYEGESIGYQDTWFQTSGSTYFMTPQIISSLNAYGGGWTDAYTSGVLLGGMDTFETSAAYVTDILPSENTLVTASMDIGTSAIATDDVYLYADSWFDAHAGGFAP